MTVATSCFTWWPRWGTDGNQKAYFFSLSLKVNLVWRALKNNTIRTPSNVGSYSVTNSTGANQRFSAEFEFRTKEIPITNRVRGPHRKLRTEFFLLRFMAQARSPRAINRRGNTRIGNLQYGLRQRG